MRLRWIAVLMLPFAVVACTDDQPAQEPVAGEVAPAAVPDAPGVESGDVNKQTDGESVAAEPAAVSEVAADSAASETTATKPEGGTEASSSMVVTADGLNVRSGPGTKHKSLRVLKKGTKVSVESCTGKWCRIGENEFVSKRFLSNAL